MTNTFTKDVESTVAQIERSVLAGAEMVRITVPALKDVEYLNLIKQKLKKLNINVPIVADIHFNQKIALEAAKIVDKVRINPGNFSEDKKIKLTNYTDQDYTDELLRIEKDFIALLNICKENDTTLRIGTNHGSLSDRIMSRYGDTPDGMAESSMEFLRFCEKHQFNKVVISMKSSNTRVMVQASRLLVHKMNEENMSYPLHLGVTEAGEGEDGRIKSAVGIGALLVDGIGDTIRVSLTEEPEVEIPVAKQLIEHINSFSTTNKQHIDVHYPINPYTYSKRKTNRFFGDTDISLPLVIANSETRSELIPDYFFSDCELNVEPQIKTLVYEGFNSKGLENVTEIIKWQINHTIPDNCIVEIESNMLSEAIPTLKQAVNVGIILSTKKTDGLYEQRLAIIELINNNIEHPVIIKRTYTEDKLEALQLKAATDTGIFFIDGLAEGIWISNNGKIEEEDILSTSFGILQASRVRTSKTEYISCPSCGRTLFDLQTATKQIRSKTNHLKGLKIGIMGCIVNGPGEMADADYGYVGAGPGKITLYHNKEVIKRGVDESNALDELIELIKHNGDWVEP